MASLSTSPRYDGGGSAGRSNASFRYGGIGSASGIGSPRLSSPRFARPLEFGTPRGGGGGGDKAAGRGTQTLCFDAAALEDPALDIPTFVASARSVAPLPAVRADLAAHAAALTADLIDTMAADFHTFVAIGPATADAGPAATAAAPGLAALGDVLAARATALTADAAELGAALDARRAAAARVAGLEALTAASALLRQCEALVPSAAAGDRGGGGVAWRGGGGLRSLERLAALYAHAAERVGHCPPGRAATRLRPRLASVREVVERRLGAAFRLALAHVSAESGDGGGSGGGGGGGGNPTDPDFDADDGDDPPLARVLNAYLVAGMVPAAEAQFRSDVVRPFATRRLQMAAMMAAAERRRAAVARDSVGSSDGGSRSRSSSTGAKDDSAPPLTPADALAAAEQEVLAFLGDSVVPLTSLVSASPPLAAAFDFAGRAVWPELDAALASGMGAVFAPGIPDVFHACYGTASRILAAVDAVAVVGCASAQGSHGEVVAAAPPCGGDAPAGTTDADTAAAGAVDPPFVVPSAAAAAAAATAAPVSLMASPAAAAFARRWNLPVYFQLRFQEITTPYDAVLSGRPAVVASSAPTDAAATTGATAAVSGKASPQLSLSADGYRLTASVALVDALARTWAPDVYLRPLAHRFGRLALQLVSRYATWADKGLAGEWAAAGSSSGGVAAGGSPAKAVGTPAALSPASGTGRPGVSAATATAAAAAAATPAGMAAADAADAALLHADLSLLASRLAGDVAALTAHASHLDLGAPAIEALNTAFAAAAGPPLDALRPAAVAAAATAIGRACGDGLAPLRGILATYRMANRPAPSGPSRFVGGVLRPLRAFLGDHGGSLGADATAEVASRVVATVAGRYHAMATELLANVQRSEDTLRRLNLGRGGAGVPGGAAAGTAAAAAATDVAPPGGANTTMGKIELQLRLDVAKFTDDVRGLGVDVEAVPEIATLAACVAGS
ncbi:hypothetical protein MMPV_007484 [Pyropia vietnamensis]